MSKVILGKVIGLKNIKTVTVEVTRHFLHPRYHKPVKKKTILQVHNEEHLVKIGDKVVIKNSRPYSATKRFLLVSVG